MAQNFIAADREQVFLMPPSLREWLPAEHLAWFVLDAVAELDLAVFYGDYRADGHGRPAHDPAMMVALVLYAYAVGERSTRRIERRCWEDVAFRVLAGNLAPDHATIARFLVRHQDALAGLFGQVLALCARAGLVRAGMIALDSTKMHANASGLANLGYEQIARELIAEGIAIDAAEDELYGQRRGDELPPELADSKTRKQRLRAAKAELEAEWEAERDAHREMLERRAEHQARTGRRPPGRPPVARDMSGGPPGRVNVTDRDSRPVKTPRGFIQGYNAHAVAAEGQIIVAADVSTGTRDQGHLEPMIAAAGGELAAVGAAPPDVVLADAGYWTGAQIRRLQADAITVLVPPDAHARAAPNPRRRGGLYEQMRDRLASDEGGALYKRRMTMIEPIFGQTKTNRRADRFQRRGLPAVRSEWRLITATHNLLKLWRATPTPAAA
jgi:transposase